MIEKSTNSDIVVAEMNHNSNVFIEQEDNIEDTGVTIVLISTTAVHKSTYLLFMSKTCRRCPQMFYRKIPVSRHFMI